MKINRELIAVAVSVALFVGSLTQVGFYAGVDNPFSGWGILVGGWMELMFRQVNWLANPVLLLAYIFMLAKKYGFAGTASFASVFLAASFLTRRTFTMDITMDITGYGIGYWLWLASTIIMALSSAYLFYVSKRETSISLDTSSENSK